MRIPPFTEDRDVDQLSALEFVDSLDFENEVKSKYKKTVQDYLLSKRWYKLVDCLEEATDYWNYGHDYVTMPLYNVYVPTRNNIVNRPKMNDEHDDETSYRYNLNRLSPFFYLNTLKGKVKLSLICHRLQDESPCCSKEANEPIHHDRQQIRQMEKTFEAQETIVLYNQLNEWRDRESEEAWLAWNSEENRPINNEVDFEALTTKLQSNHS